MPLEIELKLRISFHDAVRRALKSAHAELQGKVRETNIFFDRPDNSLLAKDAGLRVRFSLADAKLPPKTLLTFKGPRQPTGLHAREAFDLALTPHDQIIPLLEALGFQQRLLFEKDRESWQLDHCLVELDTLPALGTFVEIEGPTEEAVLTVQQKLELVDAEIVKPGYASMVRTHLAGRSTELRF